MPLWLTHFKYFVYLFLTSLGLPGCVRAFSRCGKQGLLSGCRVRASPCRGLSCCRAQSLEHAGFSTCGSLALEHKLMGLATVFPDRGQTLVPCITRQILNRWDAREALVIHFKYSNVYMSVPNSLTIPSSILSPPPWNQKFFL